MARKWIIWDLYSSPLPWLTLLAILSAVSRAILHSCSASDLYEDVRFPTSLTGDGTDAM